MFKTMVTWLDYSTVHVALNTVKKKLKINHSEKIQKKKAPEMN